MAFPAILAAPYVAPAVGEGILWGAGALGAGLTALGIIDNKDAIKDGVTNFTTGVRRGAEKVIRTVSTAMGPKEVHVTHYPRRYVAETDAIKVPVRVIMPEALNIPNGRVVAARAAANNGSTTGTAQSSRKRSRRKPATATPAAGTNTTAAGSSTAAPDPNDNKNKRPFFGKIKFPIYRGYGLGPIIKDIGRFALRDVPVTELGIDLVRNASGLVKSASDPLLEYAPNFSLTKYGNPYGWIWNLGGYTTTKQALHPTAEQYAPNYQETDAAVLQEQVVPVDTFTRAPIEVVDPAQRNNGIVFVTGQ